MTITTQTHNEPFEAEAESDTDRGCSLQSQLSSPSPTGGATSDPFFGTQNPGISHSLSKSEILPIFALNWLWIISFERYELVVFFTFRSN